MCIIFDFDYMGVKVQYKEKCIKTGHVLLCLKPSHWLAATTILTLDL